MTDVFTETQTNGPFQKYLFSGACYVQVGQCYARLCAEFATPGKSSSSEIAARLAASWHDQALAQAAMPGLMPPGISALLTRGAGNSALVDMHRTLLEINRRATETLLERFSASDATLPTFEVFFEQWIQDCASAYDRHVRSDQFVEAFGNAVNLWIRQGQ